MARPTSRKKDPVSIALIRMRKQLGMTQARFAHALGVALPTVGRWESWDPPRGMMLVGLYHFAVVEGLSAAVDFRRFIEAERRENSIAGAVPLIVPTCVVMTPEEQDIRGIWG
jgi:hypothetical protein